VHKAATTHNEIISSIAYVLVYFVEYKLHCTETLQWHVLRFHVPFWLNYILVYLF